MSMLFLEAGSGAPGPIPVELVKAVKKDVSIPDQKFKKKAIM